MMPGRSLSANTMWPLDRAGGEHHALGADLPQPLARQVVAGLGEVVADALDEADEILRVVAERRGARQHADIVHGRKLGDRGLRPVPAVLAVDLRAGLEAQRAAELGLLVAEDDAHAGLGGRERRRDAGRAAAQHQHLAMRDSATNSGRGRARSGATPRPAAARMFGS